VERHDGDVLVVDWTAHGDAAEVSVAVGTTPVFSDHTHYVTVVATTTSVRLTGLGPGRHYVSVWPDGAGRAVVAAERRLVFEGIQNFRDMGGYPTVDGGHVRWGQLFRADNLHKLTVADLDAFRSLGVRTIYDLRSDIERAEFPGPFAATALPIVGRPDDATPGPPSIDLTAADGEQMLRDMYVGSLIHSAAKFGALLNGLADSSRVPAVFHCHGGKDRTGVAAALVLLALGVDRETVLDDYEATSRYRTIVDQQDSLTNLLARGISPEAAASVLGTPRWAMGEALEAIEGTHGGVEAYLTRTAGMSTRTLRRLRDLHVAPGNSVGEATPRVSGQP
jgi:protein-tyrosine phosphatase